MTHDDERFVPKVHPATREVEAEDPLELIANPAPGDPDVMLNCMIQEFAWQGYDAAQLLRLFLNPEYPVLNQLLDCYGLEEVRRRIDETLTGFDAFSVHAVIAETPDPEDDDHNDLIQLTVRGCG
ncbi:MAG: hypothetical protein K1X57_16890 [Gemmataceae bacterium]|nr:hypothetical protein [Gemmataceae bacterium]